MAVKMKKPDYWPALEEGRSVSLHYGIANTDRTVGAMLSGRIAERFGEEGLPDGTLNVMMEDGQQLRVTPDEAGLGQVRMAANGGHFFAMR